MTHGPSIYAMLMLEAERIKGYALKRSTFDYADFVAEGKACRETREIHHIPLAELSFKTDPHVSEATISAYENGAASLEMAEWESVGNALAACIRERAFTSFWEPGDSKPN